MHPLFAEFVAASKAIVVNSFSTYTGHEVLDTTLFKQGSESTNDYILTSGCVSTLPLSVQTWLNFDLNCDSPDHVPLSATVSFSLSSFSPIVKRKLFVMIVRLSSMIRTRLCCSVLISLKLLDLAIEWTPLLIVLPRTNTY